MGLAHCSVAPVALGCRGALSASCLGAGFWAGFSSVVFVRMLGAWHGVGGFGPVGSVPLPPGVAAIEVFCCGLSQFSVLISFLSETSGSDGMGARGLPPPTL